VKILLQHLDTSAFAPLLRWLHRPLIPAEPLILRLRFYVMFLLLIALSSPFLHAYLDVALSLAELILHTALVVFAVAVAILLVEVVLAVASRGAGPDRSISTGGFLLRAAVAYLLSSFAVGALHDLTPYTRAIMLAHEAAQPNAIWQILPFALLIVYVAYQLMRADYLAQEVEGLRRLNEELRRVPQAHRAEMRGDAQETNDASLHVQANGMEIPLRADSILRIEADQNYCHVVADGVGGLPKRYLVRMTLRQALDRLPPRLFVQTHRSHVVNLTRVQALGRDRRRRELRMSNDDRVPVSRARVAAVQDGLRRHLLAVSEPQE
jgi:DNA-binding LytR/AlgR family response regulator